jgi:VIT1/CCC1 family predicted Fe2+/Mn2+ transporter
MTTEPRKESELTKASNELARVVAEMLPSDADPNLAIRFREALGNLLASTLSGATVMAAGAVVAVNNKVDRLDKARGDRLRDLQLDLDQIALRVHGLEDQFLDAGQVGELSRTMYQLANEIEQLKAQQVGDAE